MPLNAQGRRRKGEGEGEEEGEGEGEGEEEGKGRGGGGGGIRMGSCSIHNSCMHCFNTNLNWSELFAVHMV